jgi:hypothetical protein
VHGILCGQVTPSTPSGNAYFFLLVDDLSRYMWLILLKSKDHAGASFKMFQASVEAEARGRISTLRTDSGCEFTACMFMEYFASEGVRRHLTTLYSPQ